MRCLHVLSTASLSAVAVVHGLSAATPDVVRVRFINSPAGADVVTDAPAGANLLNLGDQVGLRIPRACRNGLCNSCICDIRDVATDSLTTIKACNTKVYPPEDGAEIVVDLHRMRKNPKEDIVASSMSRFGDDWENEYVADYQRSERARTAGAPGAPRGATDRKKERMGYVPAPDGLAIDTKAGIPPWEGAQGVPIQEIKPVRSKVKADTFEERHPYKDDPLAAPWDRIW